MEDLESNVIRIVANQLGVSIDIVKPETNPKEDLSADSLDDIELLMAVEEEYKIEIDDKAAEQIKTVKDLVDVIEKLNGGK